MPWFSAHASRLRVLLDAVLSDVRAGVPAADTSGRAHFSRYHFDRLVRAAVGEPPGRLRRRLLLEQAAYALGHGASVTDVAFASGYSSPEAFSRAFSRAYQRAPREFARSPGPFALSAPNGIHFHPPCGLILPGLDPREKPMDLTERLVEHDVWLTGEMLERAAEFCDRTLDRPITLSVAGIDAEPTIRTLLNCLVRNKEMWAANFTGTDYVESQDLTVAGMSARWASAVGPYLAAVRRIADRGDWDTAFVDAICEPPDTFTYGGAVAHIITFSAHRRTLLVGAYESAGVTDLGIGDPMHFRRPG